MHSLAFIRRIFHDARSSECQTDTTLQSREKETWKDHERVDKTCFDVSEYRTGRTAFNL